MDDELFDLLASTVGALELELVDAEARPGFVRVVVDRPGGADVDLLAKANRAVSAALDEHDPQPGHRYTLEVSSPGVERPLRSPGHFSRAVGETVTLRTTGATLGERRVRGTLVLADEDGFVLEGDEVPEGRRRFSYAEVERARTVFEWPQGSARAPRKGGRGRRAGAARPRRGADSERVTTS